MDKDVVAIADENAVLLRVEYSATANVHAAAFLQGKRGGVASNTVYMHTTDRGIGRISEDDALPRRLLLPKLIARISIKIVRANDYV